jgi:hypothetical protein
LSKEGYKVTEKGFIARRTGASEDCERAKRLEKYTFERRRGKKQRKKVVSRKKGGRGFGSRREEMDFSRGTPGEVKSGSRNKGVGWGRVTWARQRGITARKFNA